MLSKGGKHEAQTIPEMIGDMSEKKESGLSTRRGQSVYKPEADEYKEDKLKQLIAMNVEELSEIVTKKQVRLEDIEEIKCRTVFYLKACEAAGTFPSSLGLARSLGYSDRSLRYWRSNHPESETAQWLEMFNDLCADILNQSALKNNANNIVAIFLSKALYGFRETSEVVISPSINEKQEIDADEIRRRYLPMNDEEEVEYEISDI